MHDALKRLLIAGMCAIQVMTYAFVICIGVIDFVDFSTVARIGELVRRARQARTLITGSAHDVARFVCRMLLLTLLTALGWLPVDPSRAFDAAIAVLVMACPCASP